MTVLRLLFVSVCVGVAACGRSERPAPGAAPSSEAPAPTDAHTGESELRIEQGMLRDLRITTAKVESRQGAEQATLLGELAVDERTYAEVGAPVPARVVRLLAGVGDTVAVGQPVLELQSTEVGRARADYLTAQARLALAESALQRKRELAAERIAPQREVQEAEAAAVQARAEVRAAAAAVQAMGIGIPDGAGADGARTAVFSLRSPVRGTVIERRAMRGQMLEPGTAALRIADLSTMWLTVHAFERDALRIQPGATARVLFSALPGETFPGQGDDDRPAGLYRVADHRRPHRGAQPRRHSCVPACRRPRRSRSARARRRS